MTATSAAVVPTHEAGPPEWYTTGQVARRLGLHRETVREHVVAGKIPGWQVADGCEWRIPKWWVEEQLAKTAPIRRRVPRKPD